MISEARTNAILSLFRIIVMKDKQRMELAEYLNIMKQLKIKTYHVFHQTGILHMSQQEKDMLLHSD